jgi:16S rRNA (cytosine1402-N4)-methyltransferase
MTDPADSSKAHTPVMLEEVCAAFDFRREALLVDGTLGLGGHTEQLLSRYPKLKVIGIDWDTRAIEIAGERLKRFGARCSIHRASYADLPDLLIELNLPGVDGLLVDLGVSSLQLDDASRGFSFRRAGPFDMRMSDALERTAWDLLLQSTTEELAGIIRAYGEEPRSWQIARGLKASIASGELTNDSWAIAQKVRAFSGWVPGRTDPSTRTFQALRIAVNGELNNLDKLLAHLEPILNPDGRTAIISFHSLEDRRVKTAFHMAAKGCICAPQIPQCICGRPAWARLTPRKALQASEWEVQSNPRARSAKLRILEKL